MMALPTVQIYYKRSHSICHKSVTQVKNVVLSGPLHRMFNFCNGLKNCDLFMGIIGEIKTHRTLNVLMSVT